MAITKTILEQCAEAFKRARKGLLDAAALLYQIREENAWEGQFSSFTEYVEDGCQMNKSQASRLLDVYKRFVIEGGKRVEQLNGINPERLYLSARAGGSVDEQISRAKTLTVSELRSEMNEVTPHEFEPVTVCKVCWKTSHDN